MDVIAPVGVIALGNGNVPVGGAVDGRSAVLRRSRQVWRMTKHESSG